MGFLCCSFFGIFELCVYCGNPMLWPLAMLCSRLTGHFATSTLKNKLRVDNFSLVTREGGSFSVNSKQKQCCTDKYI